MSVPGTPDCSAKSPDRSILFRRVIKPAGFWQRARGLLGRPAPEMGIAWLFERCRAVHTCGMGYPIDVIFIDRHGRVRKLVESLPPWRAACCPQAAHTLETCAGSIRRLGLRLRQRLVLKLSINHTRHHYEETLADPDQHRAA